MNQSHLGYPPGVVLGEFSTGDVKLTFKTAADSGWVMMNDGSIGNHSSGATTRANRDTWPLYEVLWNNVTNTWAPVSGGRGASALADFAAGKTLTLPKALGRALAVSGAGASLTSRALGENLGSETHTLTEAQLPGHTHSVPSLSVTGTASGGSLTMIVGGGGGGTGHDAAARSSNPVDEQITSQSLVGFSASVSGSTGTGTSGSTGSASAHPNMQPTAFFNVMVKL